MVSELQGQNGPINSIAFSADGRFIVTAGKDSTSRIWDVNTRHLNVELRGHVSEVNSAAFSPDGNFIVTTGSDKRAIVWEAQTGRKIAELRGCDCRLYKATFSPDGKFVLTTSEDGLARIYPWEMFAPFEDIVAISYKNVVRQLTPEERDRYLHER